MKESITDIMQTVFYFTEIYKLPEYINRKAFIEDIILWLEEFSDNPNDIIIDSIKLVINGIKTNFKYSYRITLSTDINILINQLK